MSFDRPGPDGVESFLIVIAVSEAGGTGSLPSVLMPRLWRVAHDDPAADLQPSMRTFFVIRSGLSTRNSEPRGERNRAIYSNWGSTRSRQTALRNARLRRRDSGDIGVLSARSVSFHSACPITASESGGYGAKSLSSPLIEERMAAGSGAVTRIAQAQRRAAFWNFLDGRDLHPVPERCARSPSVTRDAVSAAGGGADRAVSSARFV